MIIEGRQAGTQYPEEHERDFEEFLGYITDMHGLGRFGSGKTQDDFATLTCAGVTVKDGIEAVREGMQVFLLAREFEEIEGVSFTRQERRYIEQARYEALLGDELGPGQVKAFPGEAEDD